MRHLRLLLVIFAMSPAPAMAVDTLVVMYTNNTDGNLTACDCGEKPLGGLAIRKALMDRIRRDHALSLAVDAGDVIEQFGFRRAQDSMTLAVYENLGYDAVNLGDNEFTHGLAFVKQRILPARIPWISASLENSDGRLLAQPWRIILVGHLRVGIIGVVPETSFETVAKMKRTGLTIRDVFSVLRQCLDTLHDMDIKIVLSHAGYDADIELARDFPEIDVIVGAHSQMEIDEAIQVGQTLIVQAGGNGTHLGELRLTIEKEGVTGYDNRLWPLEPGMEEDREIRRMIESMITR